MAHSNVRAFIFYTFCGTFAYAICAGFRDNYGILLPYIASANQISFDSGSFIIAVGQLFFGLMQPVFGYLVLRWSARQVLGAGALMMACGLLCIPFVHNWWLLLMALGVLLPSGTASASFGILMSCITPRVAKSHINLAGGFVGGGIGIGICALSPLIQNWIATYGIHKAIFLLAIPVAMLLPVAFGLTWPKIAPLKKQAATASFGEIVSQGLKNRVYCRVIFVFFTCGFHMALLQTHLFTQLTTFGFAESSAARALSLYGLGVLAGSVGSGWASDRWSMALILAALCFSRCLWILLLLAQPSQLALVGVVFIFGITGVAALTPIAGIVEKLFGRAWMPTLFGGVYLVHQVGAFSSAWLGGISKEFVGNYNLVWYLDIALCLAAAIICLDMKRLNREV